MKVNCFGAADCDNDIDDLKLNENDNNSNRTMITIQTTTMVMVMMILMTAKMLVLNVCCWFEHFRVKKTTVGIISTTLGTQNSS